MATLIAPYSDPDALAREILYADSFASSLAADHLPSPPVALVGQRNIRPAVDEARTPALVDDPRSHRLRDSLAFIASNPGSSNREIANAIGVTHASQISYVLSRLSAHKLVAKSSDGPGRRNQWLVTDRGRLVAGAFMASSMK